MTEPPYFDMHWFSWQWILWPLLVLLIYYVFLVRALLQMLAANANPVLLGFALLCILPAPPLVVMGVVIMVVWALHQGAGRTAGRGGRR